MEVTSNIWGTKFQLVGLASFMPDFLGQVVYKTSLLHLQPRQMTITLTELGSSPQPLSRDPNFTPAGASEEEDSLCRCCSLVLLVCLAASQRTFLFVLLSVCLVVSPHHVQCQV